MLCVEKSLKYVSLVHQYVVLVCMTDFFMPHSGNHEPLTTRTNCSLLKMSVRQNFSKSNLGPWVGYNTFLILLTTWWLPLSAQKSYKWSLDYLCQKKNGSKTRWSVLQLLPWRLKPLLPAMYNFMLFQGVWPWTELLQPVQSAFIRASDSQQHIMNKSNRETAVCFHNQAIDNEAGKAMACWIQKKVGLNICKRKDPCFLLIWVNCWQLNQASDWGRFLCNAERHVTHDQFWVADCLLQNGRSCIVLFIYLCMTPFDIHRNVRRSKRQLSNATSSLLLPCENPLWTTLLLTILSTLCLKLEYHRLENSVVHSTFVHL